MNSGSSDPNEHFARDNGTLMHSNSEKMLATDVTTSKTVARLRASVPSSSTIINDPILMADQLADALCPPLSIDEAMLPAPVIDGLIIDEELTDDRDVDDADSGVSALRLKLAAARLNDGQYDHISPSLTSSADGLPLTIWSFDKFARVDEETQSFIEDMERKIQAMRNRPRSAQAAAASSEDEAGSDEEFPETRSTENLTSADVRGQTDGERLVAKVQELLHDATYQPEASLQWQIDPARLARFQELLTQGATITNNDEDEDEEEYDDDDDDDVEYDDTVDPTAQQGTDRRKKDARQQPDTSTTTPPPRPRSGHIGTTRVERVATYEAADKKVDLSRLDHEIKLQNDSWCREQEHKMLLAELEMDRELAALTAALSQSAYELDALDILDHR